MTTTFRPGVFGGGQLIWKLGVAVGFLSAVGIEVSTLWSDPAALSRINWEEVVTFDVLWPHVAAVLGSLVIFFVFVVVAAIFLRRSLTILSEKTGVGLFGTTGLLILIGAVIAILTGMLAIIARYV